MTHDQIIYLAFSFDLDISYRVDLILISVYFDFILIW